MMVVILSITAFSIEAKKKTPKPKISKKFGLKGKALRQALQKGGYIIYMRHLDKFEDKGSKNARNALDSLQSVTAKKFIHPTYKKGVCVSESGKAEGWVLKKVMKELKIPVSKVVVSPICRCRESATMIFGKYDKVEVNMVYPELLAKEEMEKVAANKKKIFLQASPANKNLVIVAHGRPVLKQIGFDIDIPQAGTVIFKNDNGTLHYVAKLRLRDWVYLLDRKTF